MMNKRILLGIDTNISLATHHALRTVTEIMELATPQLHLTLLSVIPIPSMSSPSLGMYVGHTLPMSITADQRSQAENDLYKARSELQKGGIASEQIEALIRVGIPADEIVKAAKELQVNFIVVGSRGDSLRQKVRRFLAGSTSRRVLQLASCPVMIVTLPQMSHPRNLVAWYKESITRYLSEHPGSLTVFTS